MKKIFTKIAFAIIGFSGVATAQQDPQFTQWMHNKLIYNPGYAGTSGGICGVAQFRQQWVSFEGAPQSIAIAGDMRLQGLPIGVGLNIINDKIGPMNTLFLRAAGSWNKQLGPGTLGVGLDVGILQKKISDTWITPETGKIDPRIPGAYDLQNNPELNKISYDLGFGAFYQIPGTFYVGLSSTHLPAQSIRQNTDISFKLSRHYYGMAGYTFMINKWNKLTPNVLVKTDVSGTAIDANLTYMWSDMIWVGGTFRAGDAGAALIGYQNTTAKGLTYKIGYSYDFTLSKIKGYSSGTHEIIAGFCLTPKVKKLTSYSDPRFLN